MNVQHVREGAAVVDHYRGDPDWPHGNRPADDDLDGLFTHTDSLFTHHHDETQRIYLNPPPDPDPRYGNSERQHQQPRAPRPSPSPHRGQRPPQPRPNPRGTPPGPRPTSSRREDRLGRQKRPAKPRWRRYLFRGLASFLALALLAGGYLGYEYFKLNGNINRVNVLQTSDKSIKNAAKQRNAENFLLIGSDTRAGANVEYEGEPGAVVGARSDTTILAHLAPGDKKAILVSFPRDAWVDIPSCTRANGTTSAVQQQMFNAAFTIGGAACTIRTIQQMTGIQINHYIQVDFSGFKGMVDALGGVPICSPRQVNDPDSGLALKPGTQTLDGEQALAYVRARHNLGDGSDLDRIERQQRFLGSMMRTAAEGNLLLDPLKVSHLLDAATKSLTLDKDTSLTDLKDLAMSLKGLDPARVSFITAPIASRDYTPPGSTGGGRVLLDSTAGEKLWNSIIEDRTVPSEPATPVAPQASASAPADNADQVPDIPVQVLNGSGVDGLATKTADGLKQKGFTIAGTGNQIGPLASQTLVRYPPGQQEQAQALVNAVPGAVLREDGTLDASLILVLGQSTADSGPSDSTDTAGSASGPAASADQPDLQGAINGDDATCSE